MDQHHLGRTSTLSQQSMSEREQKSGPRRQRKPKPAETQQQRRNKAPSEQRKDRAGEPRKEERKNTFVPWLGEAKPRRGLIYDLENKVGTQLMVEFLSGRIVEGKLASYDRYMNLVLENTVERLDGSQTRALGKVLVCGRVESMGPAVGI